MTIANIYQQKNNNSLTGLTNSALSPKYWCNAVNVTLSSLIIITCTTLMNVSGYSLNTSWKADMGSLTTVESTNALAQTVR